MKGVLGSDGSPRQGLRLRFRILSRMVQGKAVGVKVIEGQAVGVKVCRRLGSGCEACRRLGTESEGS